MCPQALGQMHRGATNRCPTSEASGVVVRATTSHVFAIDKGQREGEVAGLTKGHVYRSCDDPHEVVVLLDMADVETAKVFAESADLQTAREQVAGVGMPALLFLHGSVA